MDVRTETLTVPTKTFVLLFLLITVALFLMMGPLTSGIARGQEERVLENTLPKELPIKVKIKKEKEESFKNMKNDKWVRELEIEVTNTGDKPIYYLDMFLSTNVDAGIQVVLEDANGMNGSRLQLGLRYGKPELGDIISKPSPDDVPLKPGETCVLTIHPGEVGGWEMAIRDGLHPQPTRLQVVFQVLSFGDGTGLFGAGGHPYPPPSKQQ